jgi:hypothetical protein
MSKNIEGMSKNIEGMSEFTNMISESTQNRAVRPMRNPPIHPIVLEVYSDILSKIAPSDREFADYLRKNFSELVKSDSAEHIWHVEQDYRRYIRYSVKILKDIDSTKAEVFYNYIMQTVILRK